MKSNKYKIGVIALVVMLALAMLAFAGCASAKTVIVPDDYDTIQGAVDATSPGDTIYVRSGLYIEHVTIDKNSLTLIGEDREGVIVDGGWSGDCIHVTGDKNSIVNFTVQNSGSSYAGISLESSSNSIIESSNINSNHCGIKLDSCSYTQIINNTIVSNDAYAIYVYVDDECGYDQITGNRISSKEQPLVMGRIIQPPLPGYSGIYIYIYSDNCYNNNKIDNNEIASNGADGITVSVYGYSAWHGSTYYAYFDNNQISNNIIDSNGDEGIRIDCTYGYANNNKIFNNSINFNGDNGIYLEGKSYQITDNYVSFNDGDGIYSKGESDQIINNTISSSKNNGIYLYNGNHNQIINNKIDANGGDGLYIGVGSNNRIISNKISSNKKGIYLNDNTDNQITNNTIASNNEHGIYLYSGSSLNKIYHNNFINNKIQAEEYKSSNLFDNGSIDGGNYWSDHKCDGNPSNGSQPYVIPPYGHKDQYPFEDPDGWLENKPPVAAFTYLPGKPFVNQTITFDASTSSDPDGKIVSYQWDFGDGTNGTGKIVYHSYSNSSGYIVTLVVTDDEGAIDSDIQVISVTERPKAFISTDKTNYTTCDTMNITLRFENPTDRTQHLLFLWYLSLTDYDYWFRVLATQITLPPSFNESFNLSMHVDDWGNDSFNATWYIALLDKTTYEIIWDDTADWKYVPSAEAYSETIPAEIAKEIRKEIERVELPS